VRFGDTVKELNGGLAAASLRFGIIHHVAGSLRAAGDDGDFVLQWRVHYAPNSFFNAASAFLFH
jgi:hypothetical protein